MKLLSLLFLLFSCQVMADDVIIHLSSYHMTYRDYLEESGIRNEQNFGIGIRDKQWALGIYKNSEYNTSFYLTQYKKSGNFSVNYGVVTGYNGYSVLPFGSVNYEVSNFLFSLIPAFADNDKFVPVLTFSMVVK